MKKIIPILVLVFLVTACSQYEDNSNFPDSEYMDVELSGSSKYATLLVGQWNFAYYSVVTRTSVYAPDGTPCDEINGYDTQQMKGAWTFETDGWGAIVAMEGYTCPYLPDETEFRWQFEENGLMYLTLLEFDVSSGVMTETGPTMGCSVSIPVKDANGSWYVNNMDKMSAVDFYNLPDGYSADNIMLSYSYEQTGSYDELDQFYPGYTASNKRYDGTGCTFKQSAEISFVLERK